MTFKEWLDLKGITIQSACKSIGVHPVHMSYVINHKRPTSKFMIDCIKTFTKNECDTSDLILKQRKNHEKYSVGSVAKIKRCNRFQAYLCNKYVGLFKTEQEARKAIERIKL